MKQLLLSIALWSAIMTQSNAQELRATVKVNAPKSQNVDARVFKTLESQLAEFLNNTKFTNDVFEEEERIKVNITLNIGSDAGGNNFNATMNIQASRPVFGTDFETPIFNHADENISFQYEQFQPIQYTANAQLDNLTATFSFYAFIIIGTDYDTFSSLGGESYFQTAQEIQRVAPQVEGWTQGTRNRSRYWIIENITSPRMRGYREAQYIYHRMGLDVFTKNRDEAQNRIVQALDEINKANAGYPNCMLIQIFNVTKTNEIIEIAKGFNKPLKVKIYDVMSKVDPANVSKYQQIGIDY
jgi:hypothetical protein